MSKDTYTNATTTIAIRSIALSLESIAESLSVIASAAIDDGIEDPGASAGRYLDGSRADPPTVNNP